jgi:hypothetical protein
MASVHVHPEAAPESRHARRGVAQVLGGTLKHGLRVGVALVLALVGWEAMLRAWAIEPVPFHQDAELGWMPRPHSRYFTNLENRLTSYYNERGFRDTPITPRQPNELRVLFLGDSFVEALNVHEHEMMSRRLEQLLQASPQLAGKRVRVFNGGRSGVSIAAAVRFAPEYTKLFDPDLTVVLVRDYWTQMFDPQQEVQYVEQGEGFRIETKWHTESSSRVMQRLLALGVREWAVASYGRRQLNLMLQAAPEAAPEPATAQAPQADAPGAGEKSDDRREDAEGGPSVTDSKQRSAKSAAPLDRSSRAAVWTARRLKAAYPRLLVLHVPNSHPVAQGMLEPSPGELLFLKTCREIGLPTLDMRPVIASDFARTQVPPYGFPNSLPWQGHFNKHGHELAARAVSEALLARPQWLNPRANFGAST